MLESDYRSGARSLNDNVKVDFFENRVRHFLAGTGITINGENPWDPQIYHPEFYRRVVLQGSLGLGESYLQAWWECIRLDEFFHRLIRAKIETQNHFFAHLKNFIKTRLRNLQTQRRAYQVGEAHYDLDNDIYRAMLDSRLVYTCAYWKNAANLEQAQADKLELVCRKLNLKPGMRVLDIGCGWGSFARYAAENYGVDVVGITVSREQFNLGRELCRGLTVELRLQDYRQLHESFDRIVSLGMLEHVGHKNYRAYFEIAARCLKEQGIFVLQTIGKNDSSPGVDPWIEKYIFPNGEIPSLAQLTSATEKHLLIEDIHNFGVDYDKTLMAWFENFDAAWPRLKQRHDERFYRMWKYYLLSCAGAFRAREIQLWQIVLCKGGLHSGYQRPTF